jgi:predicted DNA-binding transcriptional regulator AlpA
MANSDKSRSRKPLLSVDDAAVLLGQSRSSIYRAIGRGDLPEEGVDETGEQSGGLFGVPGA